MESISEKVFIDLLNIRNRIEQVNEVAKKRNEAKKQNCLKQFDQIWKLHTQKKNKQIELEFDRELCNDNGKPKSLQENIKKLIQHYNIDIKYNELKKEIETKTEKHQCISHDNKLEILEEYVYDKCILHDFERLSKNRLSSMLLTFADQNKYNPVKDYLNAVHAKYPVASGYIDQLCDTLESEMNPEFKNLLVKTWLISCVASAYSDRGFSSHGVLVLQGLQGIGKTSWFKGIVTNTTEWFRDGKDLDARNNDSKLSTIIYWIVELGEITSTVKKDFEQLKAFLTQDSDEMRRAYARKTSHYPRRTVFCGSVNQGAYLQDDTGNRRFWTIPINGCNFEHGIDLEKLWAETVKLYKNGEKTYLDKNDQLLLSGYNRKHEVQDFTETLLVSGFRWETKERYWLKSENVFRELGCPIGITLTKISRSLNKMGIETKISKGYTYFSMPNTTYKNPNFNYPLKIET